MKKDYNLISNGMNDEFGNKIIERIDAQKIRPLPRWRFVFWRVLFWTFAILSVTVGGLAVGSLILLFADYRAHGLLRVSHGLFEFLIPMPYAWLIIFIIFILIARVSIRHTPKGYRYQLIAVLPFSIILSVFLGIIFYTAGISKLTHDSLNRFQFYNCLIYDPEEFIDSSHNICGDGMQVEMNERILP